MTKDKKTRDKKTLTTGEAAKFCGVSFRTVIRWIGKGRLKAYQLPGRGDNRIPIDDFIEFLKENNFPIPEALTEKSENSSKILIIDDDMPMAKAIKRTLYPDGYEIKMIHNSFEAGATLLDYQPHLITLDLSMPGMDGFQVLQSIKEHYHQPLNILVISALSKLDLEKAVSLGADAYLRKPFKAETLRVRVKDFLAPEENNS